MNKQKLSWHRPQIVTIAAAGPFYCCAMLTLIDGSRAIVESTPVVVNSSDEEAKAHERKRGRLATRACRARRKKKYSFLKKPLPDSVFREIDAVAIKKLKGNPRDADGKLISFAEARVLAIADIVKAARKNL